MLSRSVYFGRGTFASHRESASRGRRDGAPYAPDLTEAEIDARHAAALAEIRRRPRCPIGVGHVLLTTDDGLIRCLDCGWEP
jgi:hypothetical protein